MSKKPKQEPVAWMYVNLDGECEQIVYGTPPTDDDSITPLYAAPSAAAAISSALAAPEPEPVAYFDLQKQVFYWARPTMIDVPMTVALNPLPLYAAPPAAAPEPESKTPAWWVDGLTVTMMREGVNKHRAREIAQGYWEAYCQIPGNEENKA